MIFQQLLSSKKSLKGVDHLRGQKHLVIPPQVLFQSQNQRHQA